MDETAIDWINESLTLQFKVGQCLYNCLNCHAQVVVPDYDELSKLCGGCLRKAMLVENVGDEKAYKRDAVRRRRQLTQYEKRLRAACPHLSTRYFAVSCTTFTFVNGYHGVAMSEHGTKLSMGIVKVDSNQPDWDWEAMMKN